MNTEMLVLFSGQLFLFLLLLHFIIMVTQAQAIQRKAKIMR